MPRDIVTLNLKRNSPEESWGFTIVGGEDIARILKVDRVSFLLKYLLDFAAGHLA